MGPALWCTRVCCSETWPVLCCLRARKEQPEEEQREHGERPRHVRVLTPEEINRRFDEQQQGVSGLQQQQQQQASHRQQHRHQEGGSEVKRNSGARKKNLDLAQQPRLLPKSMLRVASFFKITPEDETSGGTLPRSAKNDDKVDKKTLNRSMSLGNLSPSTEDPLSTASAAWAAAKSEASSESPHRPLARRENPEEDSKMDVAAALSPSDSASLPQVTASPLDLGAASASGVVASGGQPLPHLVGGGAAQARPEFGQLRGEEGGAAFQLGVGCRQHGHDLRRRGGLAAHLAVELEQDDVR